MRKIISVMVLILLLVSCGSKEIAIGEIKDIYQKIHVLSDELGETTFVTKDSEYIVIKDKAKEILEEIEKNSMDSKAKELMIESCNSIIDNCRIQIDKGWEESSKTYENVSDNVEKLEEYIKELN
ncbi:hypothetical protein [Clostridium tertium]|uniref:hypothetical protein n=1 Tax=Clostridium tertium TaxID=1559 RepID=UPI001AE55273|nr:hypothetical protein [Clostridium tertium]MBP1869017.1 major membrane immunogen (membrane-anchored lipoprotein) [Clostridium tertium]